MSSISQPVSQSVSNLNSPTDALRLTLRHFFKVFIIGRWCFSAFWQPPLAEFHNRKSQPTRLPGCKFPIPRIKYLKAGIESWALFYLALRQKITFIVWEWTPLWNPIAVTTTTCALGSVLRSTADGLNFARWGGKWEKHSSPKRCNGKDNILDHKHTPMSKFRWSKVD